jgi:hypothetical protein
MPSALFPVGLQLQGSGGTGEVPSATRWFEWRGAKEEFPATIPVTPRIERNTTTSSLLIFTVASSEIDWKTCLKTYGILKAHVGLRCSCSAFRASLKASYAHRAFRRPRDEKQKSAGSSSPPAFAQDEHYCGQACFKRRAGLLGIHSRSEIPSHNVRAGGIVRALGVTHAFLRTPT